MFQNLQHLVVMGTLPVDLLAGWTNVKLVEVFFGQRLQAVNNHFLLHRFQGMIAAQTTMKRLNPIFQLKAIHDLCELLERVE